MSESFASLETLTYEQLIVLLDKERTVVMLSPFDDALLSPSRNLRHGIDNIAALIRSSTKYGQKIIDEYGSVGANTRDNYLAFTDAVREDGQNILRFVPSLWMRINATMIVIPNKPVQYSFPSVTMAGALGTNDGSWFFSTAKKAREG